MAKNTHLFCCCETRYAYTRVPHSMINISQAFSSLIPSPHAPPSENNLVKLWGPVTMGTCYNMWQRTIRLWDHYYTTLLLGETFDLWYSNTSWGGMSPNVLELQSRKDLLAQLLWHCFLEHFSSSGGNLGIRCFQSLSGTTANLIDCCCHQNFFHWMK